MKRICTLLYLLIVLLCSSNQAFSSDSLSYYKNVIDENAKQSNLYAYKWIINYYITIDTDSSEYYSKLALNHFKKLNDKGGQAFAYNSMAKVASNKGDLKEAQRYAITALELAVELEDKNREALCHSFLARIQQRSNNIKDALHHFDKALNILRDIDNHITHGMVYANIAVFNGDIGQNDKAIDYYNKANKEYVLGGSKLGEINTLMGLGAFFYDINEMDSFQLMIRKSILLAQNHFKGKPNTVEITGYQNLAVYFYEREMWDSASFYLNKYNSGNKEIGNVTNLPDGYELLAEIDFLSKKYREAYRNLLLAKNISDSLSKESHLEEVVKIQRKYNYEMEEKKRIHAELSAVKANEQRIIYLFLALATILVAIILVLTYRSRIEKGKKELLLKEQKINELLNNQEIRALDMMMEWQEKERKRVAKDLHDRLGSMLSTIKLQFSSMEGKIEKIREENASQFSLTCNLLDEAVEEVRRVSHNMISGTLTKFGLVPALEDLANNIMASGQISCELIVSHMEERLSGNQEIMIYRMIQECVSNALKHSQAKSLIIQLIRHDEELTVMVEDDGVGFKLDDAKEKKGLGLSNVESRVKQLNGRCTFDTAPGQGTTIIAEIPLKDS